MYKWLLLLVMLFLVVEGKAQFQNPVNNGYYLKLTYGQGTHLILGASFHYVSKKGFSIAGQAMYENRDAKNIPDDFEPQGLIFSGKPVVAITTGAILVGKVYEDESKLIRFDLRAGINYGNIERPINFEKKRSTSLLFAGDYYAYDIERKWFAGLVLNPTVDFNFTQNVGLSLGIRTNINHQDITAGCEIGLLIGDLRGRLK